MSSVRLLTVSPGVCSSDTIIAEYDVLRNSASSSMNRKTIRDDTFCGERGDPAMGL
jgi:hypothetical protein